MKDIFMHKRLIFFFIPIVLLAAPADDYVIKVKTDNPGASNSNEFIIPITRTSGNGYNVDCNDDGTDEVTGATKSVYPDGYTCSYTSAGTYTIRVKDNNGDHKGFRRIRFYIDSSTTTDVLKLMEIKQWGTAIWSSMSQAYRGAENLTATPADIPDLSSTTSLKQMFQGCGNADINTTGWNTSTITNISSMFRDASIADPDTSGWDTSSVTNMRQVFYKAAAANPDVSGWDTSRVTKMDSMFRGASQAVPDTSAWDTSQVTTMAYMFKDAVNANSDVSGWNTSQVTSMRSMFKNATTATPNTLSWDTGSVTTMRSMFEDAVHANPDVTDWNVSSVTNMSKMFQNAVSFDRNLARWDVSNVTAFANFLSGGKLSTYHYDALLKGWVNLTLSDGESFDAGNSTYCDGEQARTDIIATYNWDISDAGKHCPTPCEEVKRQLKAYHWTLVSFPCETGNNGLEALLGNALGTYGDDAEWVMYEQTGADNYIGINTQKRRLDGNDTVKPGKGYWIISASDTNMTIDTSLNGLAFTPEQNASNLGISNAHFDDLNMTQLPDTDNSNGKKIMMGNPFPKSIYLSNVYFSHGSSNSGYHQMGDTVNDAYINQTVYTYEHEGTSKNDYVAITPDTPGFTDRIDPMTGFWIKLESNTSAGSNYLTFPLEK